MLTIKKGLDLPLAGSPEQHIEIARATSRVALLGDDYIGMKPTMLVAEGERVSLGQPVFEDKKNPGILFTAPASGTVVGITRGAKRKFESIEIAVEGDERIEFDSVRGGDPESLGRQTIVDTLVASGLWTAFRTRPYGVVPSIDTAPHSIFVTAIDTNPLAADPAVAMADRKDQFVLGLRLLTQLTDGKTYLCKATGSEISAGGIAGVEEHAFGGPHPAGLVGTHIHHLDPIGPSKTVWYINYQDVCMLGSFLQTGTLDTRRIVSLAGPIVDKPRLLQTRLGVDIAELIDGEYTLNQLDPDRPVDVRPISGSVLCGRTARDPHHYLGRYHHQISVLEEGTTREFLGWQGPGFDKYSVTKVYASAGTPSKKFKMTTTTHGSERAMVPLGTYERVMPLDILATQLLRSLIVRDTEEAQALGALELEEEDIALCTFVCPGKYDYGSLLRENLNTIKREG